MLIIKIVFFSVITIFTFLIALIICMDSSEDSLVPVLEKSDSMSNKIFISLLYLFIVYQLFMPLIYWQAYLGENWGYLVGAAVVLFNGSILTAIIKKDKIIQSYKNKETSKENGL